MGTGPELQRAGVSDALPTSSALGAFILIVPSAATFFFSLCLLIPFLGWFSFRASGLVPESTCHWDAVEETSLRSAVPAKTPLGDTSTLPP